MSLVFNSIKVKLRKYKVALRQVNHRKQGQDYGPLWQQEAQKGEGSINYCNCCDTAHQQKES